MNVQEANGRTGKQRTKERKERQTKKYIYISQKTDLPPPPPPPTRKGRKCKKKRKKKKQK
jgi:hypothetical protein